VRHYQETGAKRGEGGEAKGEKEVVWKGLTEGVRKVERVR